MGLTHWGLVMLWWHRYNDISMSTLAQVMTCCLTAPSHYLYQCWFIISGIKWRSSEDNFIWIAEKSNSFSEFENYLLKIIPISPRVQRVKSEQKSWALNTPLKVCIVCMIYQHIERERHSRSVNSLRPGDAYVCHEKVLSFPEWRIYASKLLYFSLSAQESLVKQLSTSMSWCHRWSGFYEPF